MTSAILFGPFFSDEAYTMYYTYFQRLLNSVPKCVIIRIKSNLSKIFLTNCSSYVSVMLILDAVTVSG